MVSKTPESTFEGLKVKPLSREEIIERVMTNYLGKMRVVEE